MLERNEKILTFIAQNANNDVLQSYFDKCHENLKDLNKLSEKYTLWLIFLIFLHIIFKDGIIESIMIGPITFKEVTLISKLLPILTTYVLFSIYAIGNQKGDLVAALKLYSITILKQEYNNDHLKTYALPLMTRIFLPYSFSNMVSGVSEQRSLLTSIIGFIVLFPIIALSLLPFYFLITMIIDIYENYYIDTLGILSFWLSIWIVVLNLFYILLISGFGKDYKK